jgi:hypothetical protein
MELQVVRSDMNKKQREIIARELILIAKDLTECTPERTAAKKEYKFWKDTQKKVRPIQKKLQDLTAKIGLAGDNSLGCCGSMQVQSLEGDQTSFSRMRNKASYEKAVNKAVADLDRTVDGAVSRILKKVNNVNDQR